jgi:hypothetical protein
MDRKKTIVLNDDLMLENDKMTLEEYGLLIKETKEIISSHIKNINKREEFLVGYKPSNYVISNLDLKEIAGYSFDDGNIYLFEECILRDLSLYFKNEVISFEKCALGGKVFIHNEGVGEDDVVVLKDMNASESLLNLTIKSREVVIDNSKISCKDNLFVVADECFFEGSNLKAPAISILANNDCNIIDCTIDKMNISSGSLNVENSIINDNNTEKLNLGSSILGEERDSHRIR